MEKVIEIEALPSGYAGRFHAMGGPCELLSEAGSKAEADTCTQAGMLSTLAMLNCAGAERFLESQSEHYWCAR